MKKSSLHKNLPKRTLLDRRVHQGAKSSSSSGTGGDTQEVSVSEVSGVRVTLTYNHEQENHKDFLSSGSSQHLTLGLVRTKSQSRQRGPLAISPQAHVLKTQTETKVLDVHCRVPREADQPMQRQPGTTQAGAPLLPNSHSLLMWRVVRRYSCAASCPTSNSVPYALCLCTSLGNFKEK